MGSETRNRRVLERTLDKTANPFSVVAVEFTPRIRETAAAIDALIEDKIDLSPFRIFLPSCADDALRTGNVDEVGKLDPVCF